MRFENNLFEDLLTLSKIEANDGPLPTEDLVLQGIVQECVDKQRVRAEGRRYPFWFWCLKRFGSIAMRCTQSHHW